MDPPYWQTEGYGVGFGIEQYEEMAEILGKLKGKTIISLNAPTSATTAVVARAKRPERF